MMTIIEGRRILWAKILLFAAFVFAVYIHLSWMMPGVDSGMYMYGSYLLVNGTLPYEHLWNNKPPLIYLIGSLGFVVKSNPFLGIRCLELVLLTASIVLVFRIASIFRIGNGFIHALAFLAIYLLCWDGGFLTETFTIPINLLALFLLGRKTPYFEIWGSLLFVAALLLKQNAIFFTGAVIAFDIFTSYRTSNWTRKIVRYSLSVLILAGLFVFGIRSLGLWNDFMDQVFVYNSRHSEYPGLLKTIWDHLKSNSFVSFKGVSLVMVFNLCVFVTLLRLIWRLRKRKSLQITDRYIALMCLVYFLSYPFVYVSGKTYPHYFMLLIVPATFVLGFYIHKAGVAKAALGGMLILGVVINVKAVGYNRPALRNASEVSEVIKAQTGVGDYVLVAGFGNQYLYVMSDRYSTTKFILPFLEKGGWIPEYQAILAKELVQQRPAVIVLNRNNYKKLDAHDFYTKSINRLLTGYRPVFANHYFMVYKDHAAGGSRTAVSFQ